MLAALIHSFINRHACDWTTETLPIASKFYVEWLKTSNSLFWDRVTAVSNLYHQCYAHYMDKWKLSCFITCSRTQQDQEQPSLRIYYVIFLQQAHSHKIIGFENNDAVSCSTWYTPRSKICTLNATSNTYHSRSNNTRNSLKTREASARNLLR